VLCGHYVCEVLRNNEMYRTNSKDVSLLFVHNHVLIIVLMVMHNNLHLLCLRAMLTIEGSWGQLHGKQIDNIYADLARFILREICHKDGEFFDNEGVLSLDDAERLRRWVS
jgi:hypothetical protein